MASLPGMIGLLRRAETFDGQLLSLTDPRTRPRPGPRPGPLPRPRDRRGQRPGRRARLQPDRAERRRLHGRDRLPGRPARPGRPGRGRRRPAHLAAAHQPAGGQGVRLTGAKIPAARAVALGLANHVAADPLADPLAEALAEALACARRICGLPRQAVESTKRLLNLQLERTVLTTLDFALAAEEQSFGTEDFRAVITRLTEGKAS